MRHSRIDTTGSVTDDVPSLMWKDNYKMAVLPVLLALASTVSAKLLCDKVLSECCATIEVRLIIEHNALDAHRPPGRGTDNPIER